MSRASGAPRLPVVLALIAAGGAIGSFLRFGSYSLWPAPAGTWPTATLLVNMTGSLLMGLFLGRVSVLEIVPPHWTPFFSTGFLGGLTTFSSFAGETVEQVAADQTVQAATYVVVTIALGWTAVRVGYTLASWAAVRIQRL